jgi:hypothetical protein
MTKTAATPPVPKPVQNALATLAVPTRMRVVRTWVGAERGENGKTRVTFVWEPNRPAGGARETAQPARVSVTAVGTDGAPYFRGRVPTTPPAGAAATPSASAASGARVTFEAPPGPLQLRLSVEGADSEVLDSENRELTVPDLTADGIVFGTPAIYRGRTVRDIQQIRASPDRPPTAIRELQRTDRLLVRTPTYSGAAVAAKILNRSGQTMTELPVSMEGTEAVFELVLAPLPTGDYILEISVEGSETKELVAFRITS